MQEYTPEEDRRWLASQERRVSSAAIALYTADDRVVVVKAGYKRYWSFPGGIIDAGETPLMAAVRETKEEVGVSVDGALLEFCTVVDRVSTVAQTYQFIFQAPITDDQIASIALDAREIADFAVVTREQIIQGDRNYSQSTKQWAQGFMGYTEQIFGADMPVGD